MSTEARDSSSTSAAQPRLSTGEWLRRSFAVLLGAAFLVFLYSFGLRQPTVHTLVTSQEAAAWQEATRRSAQCLHETLNDAGLRRLARDPAPMPPLFTEEGQTYLGLALVSCHKDSQVYTAERFIQIRAYLAELNPTYKRYVDELAQEATEVMNAVRKRRAAEQAARTAAIKDAYFKQ